MTWHYSHGLYFYKTKFQSGVIYFCVRMMETLMKIIEKFADTLKNTFPYDDKKFANMTRRFKEP
jgi:hypothetical protein